MLLGLALIVVIVGGLAWAAASGQPATAERPQMFTGSLVLEDSRPLTVIDVATAQIAVRLSGVNAQVGAPNYQSVQVVPVAGGTVLVNSRSGSFNYLEADNYVTDPNGPGVGLGPLPGLFAARGYAAGADAYIVRTAVPHSTVSLIGQPTVAQAARASGPPSGQNPQAVTAAPAAAVSPLGFISLNGVVTAQPGAVAVTGHDLWVLESTGGGCRVDELHPDASSRQGLDRSTRDSSASPCALLALEGGSAREALAGPGQVDVTAPVAPAGRGAPSSEIRVSTPFTAQATQIVPVSGAGSELWFLARTPGAWLLFGVGSRGSITGPFRLSQLGAMPVEPVLSNGYLYTLDQSHGPDPTLWVIATGTGRMAPLTGQATYPQLSSLESRSFTGAQVIVDGPRVVFNNPQSLEAVVVFTDGSHEPVVIDKSQAVAVSATGPADLNVSPATTTPGHKNGTGGGSSSPSKTPIPVVQAVSQQVTCANTTQQPYTPQITGVTPSSGTALVQWSYQLLDQTDCEPDSWAVHVVALSGGHQPGQPIQVVYGQDQYLFTGLRPSTTYQVVVTAYINRQSTSSRPVTFTSAARGPDAPLAVQTRADGAGDWVVSWTPCTEQAKPSCVVPAAQWTVVGAACGGSFVGSPPNVQVPGQQDSVTISAAQQQLLGDSLSFSVQGSLASGLTGNPTNDRSCTEAFQKPDVAALTLTGQGQQDPAAGSITATLTIQSSADPQSVFGVPPAKALFVYTVTSSTGTRTVGPVDRTSVTIPGLPAGTSLTPSVQIYPAGHPGASGTVQGAPFQQTLAWPADLAGGGTQAIGTVSPTDPNAGTITVNFPADIPSGPLSAIAPASANAPGDGPQLQCGGPGGAPVALPGQAVNPAHQLVFPLADGFLLQHGGSCTIALALVDGARPDPYGGPSPDITVAFTLGSQPSYTFAVNFTNCGDFQCGPLGRQYTIEVDANDSYQGGFGWSVATAEPGVPQTADPCFSNTAISGDWPFPAEVSLRQNCVQLGKIAVTVAWTYLGVTGTFTASPGNTPPPPATTTTTSTSTTTTSTTLAPCDTTSTSSSTDCATTTTTAAGASATGAAGLRLSLTDLAAARLPMAAGRPDPAARWAVTWSLAALILIWIALTWLGARQRRISRERTG